MSLHRLTDPQVSPDGHYVAYVLTDTDLAANELSTSVWLLDLSRRDAKPARLLQDTRHQSSPRWSADGSSLYFLSAKSGTSQVWRVGLAGGDPAQITHYPLAVGSMKLSPAGDHIALTMRVMPGCADLDCTARAYEARSQSRASGRLYDHLFVRHWDEWSDGARSHLFVAPLGADGNAGIPTDVSTSLEGDEGSDDAYAFSRDGRWIVFSMRAVGRIEAWSTNCDLFQSPVDGAKAPENLTANNPACDSQPVFLHDGDIAYLAQRRPGFESDRAHVMVRDARTGMTRELASSWDRSVASLRATPDGTTLLATADELGQRALFAIDPVSGAVRTLAGEGEIEEYSATNRLVVFGLASLGAPVDLYATRLHAKTPPSRLTAVNDVALARFEFSRYERFSFKGANDEAVCGYVMQPYGFQPGKRYPLAFVVHGGPQVSMLNVWSYRWNLQMFAAHGYGVVVIDFHGSPGYGQAFTDSISRDWGDKPLLDLRNGLTAALAKYSWIDGDRACALGASYGGYMMNWIEGNWPDRFRCEVNHDGIFDQRMMYYSTDELWFPEWEQGGTYYDAPQSHERFNPVNFVKNWRTPMLVIHSERDFRIPDDQGIATFTALQRKGIESRLLVFPDENHQVRKPANTMEWYETIFAWLDEHTKLH